MRTSLLPYLRLITTQKSFMDKLLYFVVRLFASEKNLGKRGWQMGTKDHWERVYREKRENEVSWFQDKPLLSLELIQANVPKAAHIIDIGGGASNLVDALLAEGYQHLTVLDLAAAALMKAKSRLGADAGRVRWIEADVTRWLPDEVYDLWHDRAVFHFLVDAVDRSAYRRALMAGVKPGGMVIIATFAPDGPVKCSGLPVVRYSPQMLAAELGDQFKLVESRVQDHPTPAGAVQKFQFSRFRRTA
jgi:SAM-dependent methyltransferase